MEAVRQALTAARLLAQDYAGHSFRIVEETMAAMAILEGSTIQTLGQWKTASYQLYIRMDPYHLATLSSSLSTYSYHMRFHLYSYTSCKLIATTCIIYICIS